MTWIRPAWSPTARFSRGPRLTLPLAIAESWLTQYAGRLRRWVLGHLGSDATKTRKRSSDRGEGGRPANQSINRVEIPSTGVATLRTIFFWAEKLFSRGIPLKANLVWATLFFAIAMTGCGGGGESASAPAPYAPTTLTAPAAGTAVTSAANCPAAARTFTMTDSVLAGANTAVKYESTTLSFTTPLTAITVKVCVVQDIPGGEFPATPAALTPILTGLAHWAVLADGQFDQLSNKRLTVNYGFPANAPEQYLAKKIVGYTQDTNGAWVRTVLATTQRPGTLPLSKDMVSIELSAPITAPGFFTVE
jgi:hypothetical protein